MELGNIFDSFFEEIQNRIMIKIWSIILTSLAFNHLMLGVEVVYCCYISNPCCIIDYLCIR